MATDEGTLGPRPPEPLSRGSAGGGLKPGCHLMEVRYAREAAAPERYDGTLRVEVTEDGASVASGDLYRHADEPDPRAGVPVFGRAAYRYYVRVTQLRGGPGNLEIAFELHRFDHTTNSWSDEVELHARLEPATAPDGYPGEFFMGELLEAGRRHAGELTVGWISPYLRRAVIEIDRSPGCDTPLTNEAGLQWRGIFDAIGWDVHVEESDDDLREPSGESWSAAELHAALLERRTKADLDREWRFWLACVRRLDDDSRGIMFDSAGADANSVPREAVGIAADWTFPDEDSWGLVKGLRFGSARDPFFRTALHEIGHAMGLYHNARGSSIMCPTEEIARGAKAPQKFPQNISWSYSDPDVRRLRHMPDHWVRPGGAPFGPAFSAAPELPAASRDHGLELEVVPLLAEVPIGAPVRVGITLRNTAPAPVPAPADLSIGAGHVTGSVTGQAGTVRTFRSIVRSPEPRRIEPLASGAERTGSLTLLRGADGPLFPEAGGYAIEVVVEWQHEREPVRLAGAGSVDVTPAVDEEHARAARRVLEAPDALLTVALGGDHLSDGVAAIHAALGNDQLRPHFAYLEAKRLASRFLERPPDLPAAAALLDSGAVMSPVESGKAERLLAEAVAAGESRQLSGKAAGR